MTGVEEVEEVFNVTAEEEYNLWFIHQGRDSQHDCSACTRVAMSQSSLRKGVTSIASSFGVRPNGHFCSVFAGLR